MKTSILAFGLGLCFAFAGQAQATCAIFCDATLVDESCMPTYTFETDEPVGAFGECEVQCCAPPSPEHPDGSCTTDVEPLSPDMLQILDQDYNQVDVAFLDSGATCQGFPLMVTDHTLDEGVYILSAGFETISDFEVVADTGGGCDSTGSAAGSASGFAALALMGGLGLLRRRRL